MKLSSKYLLLILSVVVIGCLPPTKGSNLFDVEADEKEIQELLQLIQTKTGIKAIVSKEGKFLKSDFDRVKPFFENLKVENKTVFSPIGEILLALGPKGQMVPFQLTYIKTNQQLSSKLLLRYAVANIPSEETAATFQENTLGLLKISAELETLFNKLSVGTNTDIKTGIDYSKPRFNAQRVRGIVKAIGERGNGGLNVKQKVQALPHGAETKVTMNLNLEGQHKDGSYYESKYSGLESDNYKPHFVADMANGQQLGSLLNAIPGLYQARDQAEQALKSKIQGVYVHLSFGKSIKQANQLQAIGNDADLVQKAAILKKHTTGLNHILIVDRLPNEPARVDIQPAGLFIGMEALKSSDVLAAVGGFLALGQKEGQAEKYKVIVSTPGTPSTFRIKALGANNEEGALLAQSDGKGALKTFEELFRKAHQSDKFVDLATHKQILLEVEYEGRRLTVKQKFVFSK